MDVIPVGAGERPTSIQMHTAELIKYRDERKALVFTLIGGETLEGVVRWFDDGAIHIVAPDRTETTLFKHGIVWYRTK